MLEYIIENVHSGVAGSFFETNHVPQSSEVTMNHGEDFKDAVAIVRDTLSPESAKILKFSIDTNKDEPAALKDSGFGVAIRNLLAEHGILWEEVVMYSVWFSILQEAIKTLLDS